MKALKIVLEAALAHAHSEEGHGNVKEAEVVRNAVRELQSWIKVKKGDRS